jgi:arsenate reductase-like glutaredoxin family protein
MLDVKMAINNFSVSLKSKPGEPLVEGKWFKKINPGESFWNIERDGDKATLNVTIEKFEGQNWWKSLLQGDIEIDTQKVEPENSKLSDLDGDTRSTVEKMMFDQAQKAKGLPTSEESEKQDKLKQFMAAHPEMDFSKAKFC